MAEFDSVVAVCPACSGLVTYQSKAGPCMYKEYGADGVPIAVANDLHGATATCEECDRAWTLNSSVTQRHVPMWLS